MLRRNGGGTGMATALDVNALRQVAAEVEARKAAEEQRLHDAEEAKRRR